MKEPNKEELEYLENAMLAVGQNLLDANNALVDMDVYVKNHPDQAEVVSSLKKEINLLGELTYMVLRYIARFS